MFKIVNLIKKLNFEKRIIIFSVFLVFKNDLYTKAYELSFLFNSEIRTDGELRAFEIISEEEMEVELNVKYLNF